MGIRLVRFDPRRATLPGLILDKQRRRIAEWSRMPIGPCRDMIESHRKMGVFVALSLEGGEHPG